MLLRRRFSFLTIILLLSVASSSPFAGNTAAVLSTEQKLAALERASGGKLGVSAVDTGSGKRIRYRADERFLFASTFKVILVAAILRQSESDSALPEKKITYTTEDLVDWSPITEKHIAEGMTVFDLCAATLQYSDNTATNLLIHELGGPQQLTLFAHSIGIHAFSLDDREPELNANSGKAGDTRNTASPAAMETGLARLALGDILAVPQRVQLQRWLKGNITGDQSIRAGIPDGWVVGDKTGSSDKSGLSNDIAVIWPPDGEPWILAIFYTQQQKPASVRKNTLAQATRLVVEALTQESPPL